MAPSDALASTLTRASRQSSLPTAARDLAAAGVPVFPCVPGGKRPLTGRGFHDATTDPDQIAVWWERYPQANIGLPTGARSGVVVVDVDVHGPVSGFAAFDHASRAGLADGWWFLVDTPSGGMHAYYPATPGVVQRSWQAARAGIDFRGDGGYIIVPPSTVTGESPASEYRVRQIGTGPARIVDSDRLRYFLDHRPAPEPRPTADGPRRADVPRLAAWVATRGEGERNRGLFWAACRLAENGVPASDALDVLTVAAASAGLGEREIVTTIHSAYRAAYRAAGPESSPPRKRGGGSLVEVNRWFSHDATNRAPVRPPDRARELS